MARYRVEVEGGAPIGDYRVMRTASSAMLAAMHTGARVRVAVRHHTGGVWSDWVPLSGWCWVERPAPRPAEVAAFWAELARMADDTRRTGAEVDSAR